MLVLAVTPQLDNALVVAAVQVVHRCMRNVRAVQGGARLDGSADCKNGWDALGQGRPPVARQQEGQRESCSGAQLQRSAWMRLT